MLLLVLRFSANDGPSTVSNARALHQKSPEARETRAPKPTGIDVAIGNTTEKPDAHSSVLKGLAGVPKARETSAPKPTDIDVLPPDAQTSALKAHSGMRTHDTLRSVQRHTRLCEYTHCMWLNTLIQYPSINEGAFLWESIAFYFSALLWRAKMNRWHLSLMGFWLNCAISICAFDRLNCAISICVFDSSYLRMLCAIGYVIWHSLTLFLVCRLQ